MKSDLAMQVSRLEGFSNPKPSLEQYTTPPGLVADLVHSADMQGNVEEREVGDLGAGTGFFAVAAAMLGGKVTAVEKDSEAAAKIRTNAQKAGVSVDVREVDIRKLDDSFHTVFTNPPFSMQSDVGEEFLEEALSSCEVMYAVLGPELYERLKEFSQEWTLEAAVDYDISLPPTMGFHTEEGHEIEVKAVHARKIKNGT
ncbi:MAG: METTL5 family protein [Candidatus Nanohaloarchaea archaeon]